MSSRTRKEKFLDFFYASPKTIKQIFRDIQHQDLGENRIEKPDPCDFLGAFYFLKKYPTKQSQAGFLACSARVALPKAAWQYVRAIQALKEKTIKWIFDEDAPINNLDEFFMLTVDGVHCRIHEPRFLPSSGWYSPKFNHAGLSYVYQETRRNRDSNYWLVKKKKKEKKKLAKLQGKKHVEDDNDFYDPVLSFVSLNNWSYPEE